MVSWWVLQEARIAKLENLKYYSKRMISYIPFYLMLQVIAESFERIHRSNLIGMGIVPLQYQAGENAESLGLAGTEQFRYK